ncbi:hypothetical protein RN001_012447 [Aquatica leii]|uniref:Acyl-coenzyme A oxidase n=1 Tax=Aquatica leii TaxID=1421715 RepID=A0AAN7NYH2_9COLE|nr:hypothetical protein RN001_012447 [Aquatica leii]
MNVSENNRLNQYRQKSSFKVEKLYNVLFAEDVASFRNTIYEEIKKYPILYTPSSNENLDEQRRLSSKRLQILSRIRRKFNDEISSNEEYAKIWFTCVCNTDISSIIQYIISIELVPNAIKCLGTERHVEYYTKIINGEYIGMLALTEVGHGSNTKQIKTTATYDKDTQEFVLNTPNFEAAKCWIGNLGKIGTHAVIYAQLITPDGVNNGLHAFIAEIRNPKTHIPHPNVIIADMGEKIDLNGIDNSILILDQYRIPRENLLNRLHEVTVDGEYVKYPEIKNPFAFSLGVLSNGRILICSISSYQISRAITIAIRYAASKIDHENEQISLLEEQTHQIQLFPYLALAYVSKIITDRLLVVQKRFFTDLIINGSSNMSEELHAITSAAKSVLTWSVLDGIRESICTCGEFSNLISTGLTNARNVHDTNCTYEGENTVLLQQTTNWFVKLWSMKLQGKTVNFPLQSINYLNDASNIMNETFKLTDIDEFIKPKNILSCYQWLVCHLLKRCYDKQAHISKVCQKSDFWVKNDSQIFFCKNLGFAYIQTYMIQETALVISNIRDVQVQQILNKLLSLFGVWNLQKHIVSFYEGGYAASPNFAQIIEDSVLFLCKDIKKDAVCLVDVIGPSDDFIKSTIGRSDGQIYTNFRSFLMQASGTFS